VTTAPHCSRVAVLGEYRDGVRALSEVTMGVDADRWAVRACGTWTIEEVARHVLAVADWYHAWLDRGLAGDGSPPFTSDELEARNAQELARRVAVPGNVAIEQFTERAASYGARVRDAWDTPYGFPSGTVTAGLHLAVAAAEWHLHAWDVARAVGREHRPGDPETLLNAVIDCFAVARGGVEGNMLRTFAPAVARFGDPWASLLRRSGRRPPFRWLRRRT